MDSPSPPPKHLRKETQNGKKEQHGCKISKCNR